MNWFQLPIRWQSLRTKAVLALVVASCIIAALGVLRVKAVYAFKQEQQLQSRAQTLADAIAYFARSTDSTPDLQRFVRAASCSEEVLRIVVVANDPPEIVADSQPGRDDLHSHEVAHLLAVTQQGRPQGDICRAQQHYDFSSPSMVATWRRGALVYTSGAVFVQLDTRRMDADLTNISLRVTVIMLSLVVLTSLATYGLLYRWVLLPARDLANVLQRRASGDVQARARMHSHDELGRVAVALNRLLEALDRKEAERCAALESLSASEALAKKLSMVASRTDNGVVITDQHGHIEWANEGFTHITGYSLDEVLGQRPGALLQGADSSRGTIRFMRERLLAGEAFSTEIINYHKDGTTYWVSIDVQPVRNDAGELTHFVAIQRDITTDKEAQAEQQKFVSLVENSSDFIAMASLEGHFSYVNPAGCRLVGLTGLAQAIRSKLTDLVNPDTAEFLHSQAIATALSTGFWTGELVFRRLVANERIDIQATIFLVRDPQSGQAICLAVVGRDVTERKRAESRLLRSHQEIAAARVLLEQQTQALQTQNEELRLAREKAEAAAHAKTAFLANMSHEIRTPMTAILGFADMLLSSVKEPEAVDAVQTIHRNGEHLLAIINDILDISKIEADRMQVEQLEIDPLTLLDEVMTLMRGRADAKGLAFTRQANEEAPARIVTDPTRLRQILINLLGNAIKFTEEGSVTVTVGLEASAQDTRHLYFDVTDTGIGLDAQQIHALFQPFVQADNSMTRRFGGTGLGLTISQRFAQMLGGEISVTSELGRGSTFRVRISTGTTAARSASPAQPAATTVQRSSAQPLVKPLQGYRVLLAEDGVDNQRIISFHLTKAGADVTVVENGKLAVETLAGSAPFDAVLLDMQMPVMDGYEAAAQLRRDGYTGPVIALTAHAMRGDREKCLAAGCSEYTTKPVDRATLLSLLVAQLELAESAP